MNSSRFMSLGVIPEIETLSYAELRNREEAGLYTEDMMEFLSGRLYDFNEKYGVTKKLASNIVGVYDDLMRFGIQTVKGFRRRLFRRKRAVRIRKRLVTAVHLVLNAVDYALPDVCKATAHQF